MSDITYGPKLGKLINADIGEAYPDDLRAFLRSFDALVQGTIISNAVVTPPSSPSNGDAYIIPAGATGVWSGLTNLIGVWSTEITLPGTDTKVPGWEYYTPNAGWEFYATSLGSYYMFNGSNWIKVGFTTIENEIPGGTKDGVNLTFTLANTPITNSVKLYLNGLRLSYTTDFTISGNTISMISRSPNSSNGDTFITDYRY